MALGLLKGTIASGFGFRVQGLGYGLGFRASVLDCGAERLSALALVLSRFDFRDICLLARRAGVSMVSCHALEVKRRQSFSGFQEFAECML